jgi:hypothetical protein
MLPTKAKRLTIKTYSMMPNKEQKAHECDAREAASTTADDPQKSSQEEIEAESLVNNSRFGYPGDRYSERDFEAAKNLVLSGIEWALSRRGEEIESKAVGFAEWIKANGQHSFNLPVPYVEVFIRYDERKSKEVGDRNHIIDLIENGWLDVEWLNEASSTTYTKNG